MGDEPQAEQQPDNLEPVVEDPKPDPNPVPGDAVTVRETGTRRTRRVGGTRHVRRNPR